MQIAPFRSHIVALIGNISRGSIKRGREAERSRAERKKQRKTERVIEAKKRERKQRKELIDDKGAEYPREVAAGTRGIPSPAHYFPARRAADFCLSYGAQRRFLLRQTAIRVKAAPTFI